MRPDQFLRQLDHRGHVAEVDLLPPGALGLAHDPWGVGAKPDVGSMQDGVGPDLHPELVAFSGLGLAGVGV